MSGERRGFDPTAEGRNREERAEVSKVVQEHFVDRLKRGGVGALLRTLLSDPVTQRQFQETHRDRGVVMAEKSKQTTIDRVSAVVISLMRDKEYRKLFMDTVIGDFQENSDLRHDGIQKANEAFEGGDRSERTMAALVYDEVVVGGGVHAAIYNIRRTMDNPTIKSLTLESGKAISSNFRTKGFVSMNTMNTPHEPGTPSMPLKKGNLNFYGKHAPVQLPYIENERFPAATTFADVATANQYLSNSDVLFDAGVERIVKPSEDPTSSTWPAKYKVLLSGGEYVFTNRAILSTGLGEATMPVSFDDESMEVVRRAMDSEDKKGGPPAIMTYEDFATYVTDSEEPYRHFVGKKIDMCGAGDGSATAIEFLLRWANKDAYKKDVVQVGEIDRINWVGQTRLDREEYLKAVERDRYAPIAGEMPIALDKRLAGAKDKKIHPVPGHLVQVRDSDRPDLGRFRVIYQSKDPTTGEMKLTEGYTDIIILATGYKNKLNEVLGTKENPFDDLGQAEAVKGTFEDIDARLPVAAKVKNEEIYAIGPVAVSEVLADAEFAGSAAGGQKKGKKDLLPNIAAFGPRSEKLAELLSVKDGVRDLPRVDFTPSPIQLREREEAQVRTVTLTRTSEEKMSSHMSELRTRLAAAEVFQNFRAPEGMEEVDVVFEYASPDSVTVRFQPSLDSENCRELCAGFSRYKLPDLILSQLSASRFPRLELTVPFTPKGNVDVAGITMNKPAVRRARAA